jgi:glycosyltransferase involved in cell wall biosynthesis
MRLNLHDFSGHPFQVQLSRNLAGRGHDVLHEYSSQYVTGHGRLSVEPDDPPGFRVEAVTAAVPMVKYSPVARTRFELAYASAWQRKLARSEYDVVIACNVPLFALAGMRRFFARHRQPWVLWHQDIYSLGVAAEAARRLPKPLAQLASAQLQRVEKAQVASADAVIAITEPFLQKYAQWGVRTDHVTVIPNWAPLDELTPGERDNAWARRQKLPADPVRLLYAGTLGRKHNPLLLLQLLDGVRARGLDATLIVVSEGVGADDLAMAAAGRDDVRIIGYQPAEVLGEVLASADVMLALLEPDAARFSVPSKVLSYLCAGRPIIALVPDGNPSADDVRAGGGFVAPPTPSGARQAAEWLTAAARDREALVAIGKQARNLAIGRFNVDRIGSQFETILEDVARRGRSGDRPSIPVIRSGSSGGLS